MESEENHIFNVLDYLSRVAKIQDQLDRSEERKAAETRIKDFQNKIEKLQKPKGIKIFILSGGGDLFPANQIYYKILKEIPAEVTIKAETPTEKYDILITFGSPLTPEVEPILFKYLDRGIINKMLASSGYWIRKPTHEGEPLIISIAGYTMFHTRAEAEKFVESENFQDLVQLL